MARKKGDTISALYDVEDALGQRVAFIAPVLSTDVGGDVGGVELEGTENGSGGFHDVVADTVAGHSGDVVLGHMLIHPDLGGSAEAPTFDAA